MRVNLILVVPLLLVFQICYSQDRKALFVEFLDRLEDRLDDEKEIQDLYLVYENFYDNPIDLNSCTTSDLRSLHILSENQIDDLIRYRKQNGILRSVYEVSGITEISEAEFRSLFPFVKVNEKESGIRFDEANIAAGTRLIPNAIRKDSVSGSLQSMRFKAIANFRNLQAGLALKKDRGEPLLFRPAQRWFLTEHVAGFVSLEGKRTLRKLILGNFQINSGSGLIFGNGRFESRTINPIISGYALAARTSPFASFLERQAFTGVLANIVTGPIAFSPFVSMRNLNGSLRNDSIESISKTTNLYSASTLLRRGKIKVIETGASLTYEPSLSLLVGFNIIHTRMTKAIKSQSTYYYKAMPQPQNNSFSFFMRGKARSVQYWSEIALMDQLKTSLFGGLVISASHSADITLSYRRYAAAFYGFHSNPVSKFGIAADEEAIFMAIKLEPAQKLQVTAFSDMIATRRLRYLKKSPSNYLDSRVSVLYHFTDETSINLWFRNIQSPKRASSTDPLAGIVPENQNELGLQLDHKVHSVAFRTRAGIRSTSRSTISAQPASYLYQQIAYKKKGLKCTTRMTLFEVADPSNRFYLYENDLTYNFSTQMLSGRGFKFFYLLKYRIWKSLELEAKWSILQYFDRASITSVTYQTVKPSIHEVAFQIVGKL